MAHGAASPAVPKPSFKFFFLSFECFCLSDCKAQSPDREGSGIGLTKLDCDKLVLAVPPLPSVPPGWQCCPHPLRDKEMPTPPWHGVDVCQQLPSPGWCCKAERVRAELQGAAWGGMEPEPLPCAPRTDVPARTRVSRSTQQPAQPRAGASLLSQGLFFFPPRPPGVPVATRAGRAAYLMGAVSLGTAAGGGGAAARWFWARGSAGDGAGGASSQAS